MDLTYPIVIELEDEMEEPIQLDAPTGPTGDATTVSSTCAKLNPNNSYNSLRKHLRSVANDHLSAMASEIMTEDPETSTMFKDTTIKSVRIAWGGGLEASDTVVKKHNYHSVLHSVIARNFVDVMHIRLNIVLKQSGPNKLTIWDSNEEAYKSHMS